MQKELQKEKTKRKKIPTWTHREVNFELQSPQGIERFKNTLLKEARTGKATFLYELSMDLGKAPEYLKQLCIEHPELKPIIKEASSIVGMRGLLGVRDFLYEKDTINKYLHKHLDFVAEINKEEHELAKELRQASKQEPISFPLHLVTNKDGSVSNEVTVDDNITFEGKKL